ncbi:hypothetical protein [Inquilinus limosus]|uniref:hypothetical protein n=1 Tax=Inquilinus limosus TaxID=171674 RepID=UPI00138AE467|nr:hypothetical protein [Inquilinus limosus]
MDDMVLSRFTFLSIGIGSFLVWAAASGRPPLRSDRKLRGLLCPAGLSRAFSLSIGMPDDGLRRAGLICCTMPPAPDSAARIDAWAQADRDRWARRRSDMESMVQLIELLKQSEHWQDDDATIYVTRPWSPSAQAVLLSPRTRHGGFCRAEWSEIRLFSRGFYCARFLG